MRFTEETPHIVLGGREHGLIVSMSRRRSLGVLAAAADPLVGGRPGTVGTDSWIEKMNLELRRLKAVLERF